MKSIKILLLIAVLSLAACNSAKKTPGKVVFDRVPFVYLTINGERHLFMIDTGASTSALDKRFADKEKIAYWPTGFDIVTFSGESVPAYATDRIRFEIDSTPYSAVFTVQDLTAIRRSAGRNIQGLIGSDVLNFYNMTLDFKDYVLWEKE